MTSSFSMPYTQRPGQILIYSGQGCEEVLSDALENQVKEHLDDRIYRVCATASLLECWSDPASIRGVFVPGGHALAMWMSALQEAAPRLVKHLKEYQIPYYGVCAGAILAGSGLHPRLSSHGSSFDFLDRASDPFFNLVPCRSIAAMGTPVEREFGYEQIELLPTRSHEISFLGGEAPAVTHMSYPCFLDAHLLPNTQVLSTYDNLPTLRLKHRQFIHRGVIYSDEKTIEPERVCQSLIYSNSGQHTLLAAGHLEIDSKVAGSSSFKEACNLSLQEQAQLVDQLKSGDAGRAEIFRAYMEKLGVQCKPTDRDESTKSASVA